MYTRADGVMGVAGVAGVAAAACLALAVLSLASGPAGAATADESCLVARGSVAAIDGLAQSKDADDRMSVLRPCVGKVKPKVADPVEVLFGTSGGGSMRLGVRAGESLQERIASAIGPGNQLIDIWPDGSILQALGAWVSGKRQGLSGVSGFEGAGDAMPLKGDLAALPGTALPLKVFGWAPDQPVTLSQGGKSFQLVPVNGLLSLPAERLVAGELRLAQPGHQAVLTVLPAADLRDLHGALKKIDAQQASPAQRAMLRASALQQEQLLVNAIAEYMKAR